MHCYGSADLAKNGALPAASRAVQLNGLCPVERHSPRQRQCTGRVHTQLSSTTGYVMDAKAASGAA